MQLRTFVAFAFVLLLPATYLLAQPTLTTPASASLSDNVDDLPVLTDHTFTFYHDEGQKVYYIDFESIPFNLRELRILDHRGNLVFSEEVWQLPVNTIYEVNFTNYKPGVYEVELRTFTSLIRKEVFIDAE